MGQNAEVMPRSLNLSIMIHSLEVRTIFSIFFKETHAWFCADYFCISYGVEICLYPEHVAIHRSVNGGLVHSNFIVTRGMAVSMREN